MPGVLGPAGGEAGQARGGGGVGRAHLALNEAAHKEPSIQIGISRTACSGEAVLLYMSRPLGCFSILVSFIGSGSNSPYRGRIK